ncbi:hypothetical protein C8039_02190 [Halogeometricum sp. wsp3]|nr:hypothetical protein C8039_02190 [Halogeometricum sp. wsp3]
MTLSSGTSSDRSADPPDTRHPGRRSTVMAAAVSPVAMLMPPGRSATLLLAGFGGVVYALVQ